ncbi:hypothetical protein [Microbacterium aerolatum]|uniref:Uncharacterized protein n=1 Tax=Microbacterium aerolatum TaxID=153731 RepID=A0A511AIA8_9MICO|nr:hypothetical protein [Microbacterium aerolatum]GEK87915.1 hypothetical protein MAE01_30910 [Microbacterium aerolatum]GGB22130.1 hypothetical protein GCM10007198_10740 [Microbacterium aerolatum]
MIAWPALVTAAETGQAAAAAGSFAWWDFWPVLVAVLALAWGIREWVYGGSLLKVQFELGYTDGLQLVRANPNDFVDPSAVGLHFGRRITNPAIDVAVITVVNRGRTAATVLRPGLYFTMRGIAPVFVGGLPLRDLGEGSERVRVEAHDACTFVVPLGALVRVANADVEFQKSLEMRHAVYARAQVTSGTGRIKRSSRLIRHGWRMVSNRWKVVVPLRGKAPRIEEALVDRYLIGGSGLYDQFVDVGAIVGLIRLGKSDADILEWAQQRSRDLLNTGMIAGRARVLLAQE